MPQDPTKLVDIFDAGPVLKCATKDQAKSLRQCLAGFDARLLMCIVLHITPDTAVIFGVDVGDHLRCMPSRPDPTMAS